MRTAYEDEQTEGVLFADASNAFNRLNRTVCLSSIQRLCLEIAPAVINTYRSAAQLYVGGEVLLSSEGTTQGDPLAMPMYALGTIPLIRVASGAGATQLWYADDAIAAGSLRRMHACWLILEEKGGQYGYHLNASKSVFACEALIIFIRQPRFSMTPMSGYARMAPVILAPLMDLHSSVGSMSPRRLRNGAGRSLSSHLLRHRSRKHHMQHQRMVYVTSGHSWPK